VDGLTGQVIESHPPQGEQAGFRMASRVVRHFAAGNSRSSALANGVSSLLCRPGDISILHRHDGRPACEAGTQHLGTGLVAAVASGNQPPRSIDVTCVSAAPQN
jgi:hypothetical protein